MGKNQSTAASWSVDDWAFGTGQNAVSMDEVVHETRKIPDKYFGGQAIQNDASMHQMQRDLLVFDQALKGLFRRKKSKRPKNDASAAAAAEEYPDYEERPPVDSDENYDYLQPTYADPTVAPSPMRSSPDAQNKLIWRCGNCTVENKVTEHVCRRCGHTETEL